MTQFPVSTSNEQTIHADVQGVDTMKFQTGAPPAVPVQASLCDNAAYRRRSGKA